MKRRLTKLLALATGLFALSAGFLINYNIKGKKHYKPGDYVPEEGAYFVEEIDDPAGLVKAKKFVVPSDNQYKSQKTRSLGSGLIGNIESVWNNYKGAGTTIAVLDDGFDYDHPEYTRSDGTSAILSTSRYYYASGNTAYYKSYSSDPTCIAEDWNSTDGEWDTHGTNTSTTAAAPMGNGGGVGIAPEADILAIKIDFSLVSIKAAIQYAIDEGVDVINMSLGAYAESFTDGWGESQTGYSSTATYLNSVCQSAYDSGIIVVAAAGNEATWHKSYPACNSKVVAVGATGDWDSKGNASVLAEFTNYVGSSHTGEINVDILAPGYVYTATQGGKSSSSHTHTYSDTQGTSFSCPIVAGAAALWKSKYPNGTPAEFLTQLQSSADGIGYYTNKNVPVSGWDSSLSDVGPSNITNGRLNVAKLMSADDAYVSLEESTIGLIKDDTKQVPISSYNGTLSYSSSNTNVATVSDTGLITAKNAGTATITVTATKGSTSDSATLTVNVSAPVNVTSITLSPSSTSIEAGTTYDIAPTISVSPSNATKVFLYESSDPSIASVDEDTGVVTGVKAGTTEITVLPIYGSCDATLTVTVTPSTAKVWKRVESTSDLQNGDEITFATYNAKNVSGELGSNAYLSAISATFASEKLINTLPDGTETFTVGKSGGSYTFTQKSNGELLGYTTTTLHSGSGTTTWTVSISSGIAEITGGGYQLAYNTSSPRWKTYASTFAGGSYSIFRKSSADSGSTVSVTGVSVSPTALSLTVGDTSTLTATVSPGDATNKNVTWSSNNTSVATVSGGTVTAVAAGSATITVTTEDGDKTATCSVTVNNATVAVTGVSLNKQSTSIAVGGNETLTATVSPNNATNKTVSWSTSAPNIASVNSSGQVTGLAAGSATITATTADGGFTASCTVTVTGSGGGGGGASNVYTLVTSTSGLETGAKYIITSGKANGSVNAISTESIANYRGYTSVTVSSSTITLSNSSVLILELSGSTGSWIFTTTNYEGTDGRFYPASGKNNELHVGSSTSTATISFSNDAAEIRLSGNSDNRGLISWNDNANPNRFACYKSTQKSVYLWKQNKGSGGGGDTPEEVTLSSIAVSTAPTKTSYEVGEYFNPSGLVITRNYSNSTSDTYSYAGHTSEFTFDPSTSTALQTSDTSVTITYGGKETSQVITVTSSGGTPTPTPTGESYQITFKTGSDDNQNMTTSTSEGNYLTSGGEYISDIESVTKCYYAAGSGLKIGTSSAGGEVTFNLAGNYNVTTIVVNAKLYNSSKAATLSVNGSSGQSLSSSFDDYEYSINDTMTELTLASSKYIFVSGVTINLADDEGKVVQSITATYSGSNPYVGEALDESKVNVVARFTDSTTYPDAALKSSDYSLTGYSSSTEGTKTVTVTYTGPLDKALETISTTFTVTVVADTLSSIVVVSDMNEAHPGDVISKENLTLTATYSSGRTANISEYTFENYQFKYSDAPSGGAAQNKEFTVNYGGKSASFTVSVSRLAYSAPQTYSTEITGSQAGSVITIGQASSANDYSNIEINGMTFNAHNIYVYNQNGKFMSFGTGAGYMYTVNPLQNAITDISLTNRSNARTDGKLYVSEDGSNWILKANADFANSNYRYFKIEFDEGDGSTYSNFSKINLTLRSLDTPNNLANYIMYTDTEQQCTSKFDVAEGYFNNMTAENRALFMSDDSYVISTARERFLAWAKHEGKTISYVNNDYVVTQSKNALALFMNTEKAQNVALIVGITLLSFTALGGYFFLRKRKEQ